MTAPWLCRYGLHTWRTVAVSALRDDDAGQLCSVTARCGRCPATRHEQNRRIPLRARGGS